uniref:protein rep n=1 Tax=Propionibacterium freudenreichii TaxID=1744 RepID=UPI0015952850|nr:protein rep [Propionibacterium freudenreichii]
MPAAGEVAADKRKHRFSVRYWLWRHTSLKRVAFCGRVAASAVASVGVRCSDGRAGFAGLQSCGSVWACPVCNAKIMARRGLELGAAVETWTKHGGRVAFMTFTVRHSRKDSLTAVWDGVASGWRRVTSGKGWTSDQLRHGVEGFVRVVEVTHGRNGWHVHLHVLVFLVGDFGDALALHRSMFGRWERGVLAAGLGTPLARAQDVQQMSAATGLDHLARYLSKAQFQGKIGHELTNSQSKTARSALSTRSTWEVLGDAANGLAKEVGLWFEWEKGSRGRRQIGWSAGLRDRLGLMVEESDDVIAAEEVGSVADTVALITGDGWRRLVGQQKLYECLRSCELGGQAGLARWLQEHGIEHELVEVD